MSDPRRISEEEARELWRRAAELQAASERAGLPAPRDEDPGLSLAEITDVAESAGIHPDHVRVALAERRLPDAEAIRRDRLRARLLRAILPGELDVIEVDRTVSAAPEQVLEGVRRLFPLPPFSLVAETSIGDDPLRDGVLVYRLGSTDASGFASAMNWADARVVLVTLRGEGTGTRLRLRVPLFRRGINLALASGFGAGAGWLGVWGGSTLAGALGLAAAAVAAPAAVAGLVLGVGGYRRLYRGVVEGGVAAVNQLAQAVAIEAERAPGG